EPSPTTPPTETALPSDTPEPTEVPTLAVQMARVIAESGLVVRENPDTAALILAYLNYGTEVIILGESISEQGINWEKIELSDGTVGWSTAQFLEKLSEDN
ncbi:MAG: SH3 domain-containing protein, partial [Anaerolineaceae bacterium]|nr:SH3 domain-containing protein [Anaerolineaceae bacterium]